MNCTGPFAFDRWTSGQSITLTRYDDYWDASLKAKSGSVKFVFIQDPNTRVNAWKNGEVDGGWQVPSNAYTQLQNGGPGTLYYGLNTTVVSEIVANLNGALGDPQVREALLMAIDREGIIKAGEAGVGEVAEALVTRSTWGGLSPATSSTRSTRRCRSTRYDVAKAKALASRGRRGGPGDRHRDQPRLGLGRRRDRPGDRAGGQGHRPGAARSRRSRPTSTRRCSATRRRARASTSS